MLDMAERCPSSVLLGTLNGHTSTPLEFQGLLAQSFFCIDANIEAREEW